MKMLYEGKSNGSVTIKDISARLNVSSTSVHRALTGKEGISDTLREQILTAAQEMGYEVNYAASSIKRRPTRIAVILPQDSGIYFEYIWRGLRNCARVVRGLNVEVHEFICTDELSQCELLKVVADAGADEYSGVITYSYSRMPKVLMLLQQLVAQKICTVVIEDELKEPEGLYCIPANEKVTGRVAAEFGALITPECGTVLVSEGRSDSVAHINKVNTFVDYLTQAKPGLKVKVVKGYSTRPETDDHVCKLVQQALIDNPDTVMYYALTSHDNHLVVKAVQDVGMQDQVAIIGTDLNEETAHFLRAGALKAVINQGAYMKGYSSLEVLVDSVVKHVTPPQRVDCPIDIVLRSNLSFYERSNNITNGG